MLALKRRWRGGGADSGRIRARLIDLRHYAIDARAHATLSCIQVRTKLGAGAPSPNSLSVRVGTAVGLPTGRANILTGERSCRPRVVLSVRGTKLQTKRTAESGGGGKGGVNPSATALGDGTAMAAAAARTGSCLATEGSYSYPAYFWGEDLELAISDPSAVLHICVYDGANTAPTLLGQWMTTLKWLVLDPSNCEHSALHVGRDGAVSGWFVLSDAKWGGLGSCGEVHLRLHWRHAVGLEAPTPLPLTALEQLSMNSAETALRLGNPAGVQSLLSGLPFLLDVKRIAIRDVEFFVKDLFMGRRGQVSCAELFSRYIFEKSMCPHFLTTRRTLGDVEGAAPRSCCVHEPALDALSLCPRRLRRGPSTPMPFALPS